jgi:tetratricopeptide (TPR) repeat protein
MRIVGFGIIILTLCLCSFCQNKDKNNLVATIDSFTLTRDNYNSFMETRRFYPSATGDYFPGDRQGTAFLLATMILSDDSKARSMAGKLKSGLDWEWKQRYFPAQVYLNRILAQNRGFTDKELEGYYKAHLDIYKVRKPLPPPPADTSKAKAPTSVKDIKKDMPKDTVIQKSFLECKEQIIQTMFLAKYPVPDSLFKKKDPKDTVKVDSNAVRERYLYMVKNTLPNFFMNKSYEQKFKHKLPDSLSQWYGKGKLVTPEDMDVILHWLPEAQRSVYATPAGTADLAKWLLKWKLFTEDAKKSGFASTDEMKRMLDWAWRMEVATNYVNNQVVPAAKASAAVDTAMCVYAMWDERNAVTPKDTAGLNRTVSNYIKKLVSIKIDSMIYSMRKQHAVTYIAPEFKDEQSGNPTAMIAHADSLRDTGNTSDAAGIYRQLVTSFPFTPEGVRSYTELAKVQTEKAEYSDAVKNYRDFLVLANDKSKRCNTFFMIGFIYDEYLNKSDIAEANYKWVLKNTPECELADDAEFMTLHLGEPMNSVEELRAEARRQGRKVDTSSPPDMPVDSGLKGKAKK